MSGLRVVRGAASGNVLNSPTASASDVNSTIASASGGDTVLLPSGASATWSTAVSLPSDKYITLDLNGSTITIGGGGSATFTIADCASGLNRVTNGSIVRTTGYDQYSGPFIIADERGGYGVRVDHIGFSGVYVIVGLQARGPGVMDHCTFTGMTDSQEFLHIDGWGAGYTTGWTNDAGSALAGSGNIFYIEDCTFTSANSQGNVAWIEGFYGCRVGIRYNTFDGVSVDMHGTPGEVGARWWEVYENTFQDTRTGGNNMTWSCSFRAGSGVIYNNTFNAGSSGRYADIGLCEEDSGYPADYQIGRGLNQTSDPAYVWSNTNITLYPDQGDAPEVAGMVQLNRDVYASARSGYSTYTYPHPLIA